MDALRPKPRQVVAAANGLTDEFPNVYPKALWLEGQEIANAGFQESIRPTIISTALMV